MAMKQIHHQQEFFVDTENMERQMGIFGLRIPTNAELSHAIAITEALIDGQLAEQAVIEHVQKETGITTWVIGDPVDGFFLIVPLTYSGELSVRNGSFRPSAPDPLEVASRNQHCAAVYVGVYAAKTKECRRSIMQASATLRVQIFGTVPCFARAATDDGARSMTRLGFSPVDGGLPDLYVQEALVERSGASA
jgi:hypothetical protein